MNNWLHANCRTSHHGLYFYCLEDSSIKSRLFYIEHNQLQEDAATGSASTCLQASLLKYHAPEIDLINYQGDYMNRPSQIHFKGKLENDHFDIKIGGKAQFVAKGEWEA